MHVELGNRVRTSSWTIRLLFCFLAGVAPMNIGAAAQQAPPVVRTSERRSSLPQVSENPCCRLSCLRSPMLSLPQPASESGLSRSKVMDSHSRKTQRRRRNAKAHIG